MPRTRLMTMRNNVHRPWPAFGAVLCCFCAVSGAPAQRLEDMRMPAPPCTASATKPACQADVVEYLYTVVPFLPADARTELSDLLSRNAADAELLGAVHGFRLRRLCVPSQHHYPHQWTSLTNQPRTRAALAALLAALSSSNATPSVSLDESMSAWRLFQELTLRVAHEHDSLHGVQRYAPALSYPGIARHVYNLAYALFWRHDYARAQQLFALLISSNNTDGFTIGNSHYWLGYLLWHFARNPDAALPHFLAAHRYPACLVHIDAAGREAAEIFLQRGQRDIAAALLAQQIPSFVFWNNELFRAARGFDIARSNNDLTNIVRNLLRMSAALPHRPHSADDIATRRAWIVRLLPPHHFDAIAHYLLLHEPWGLYQSEIISRALSAPDHGARNPDLVDCLLHDWPSLDDVAQAHPEILTNRPASNNIFQQRRRSIDYPQP